jgi:hypothetical protein
MTWIDKGSLFDTRSPLAVAVEEAIPEAMEEERRRFGITSKADFLGDVSSGNAAESGEERGEEVDIFVSGGAVTEG